jgi:hypothetical protein
MRQRRTMMSPRSIQYMSVILCQSRCQCSVSRITGKVPWSKIELGRSPRLSGSCASSVNIPGMRMRGDSLDGSGDFECRFQISSTSR